MNTSDEALHLVSTQNILNIFASGQEGDEWKEIAEECNLDAFNLFYEAAEQEKEWAEYLFKDGSMIGLNKDILGQYIEYITNRRLKAVGLPTMFEIHQNPIPWINAHLRSDTVQVAPQETEISSYLVGQIDATISPDEFDDMEI